MAPAEDAKRLIREVLTTEVEPVAVSQYKTLFTGPQQDQILHIAKKRKAVRQEAHAVDTFEEFIDNRKQSLTLATEHRSVSRSAMQQLQARKAVPTPEANIVVAILDREIKTLTEGWKMVANNKRALSSELVSDPSSETLAEPVQDSTLQKFAETLADTVLRSGRLLFGKESGAIKIDMKLFDTNVWEYYQCAKGGDYIPGDHDGKGRRRHAPEMAWCHLLGQWLPKASMKCAHLVPRSMQGQTQRIMQRDDSILHDPSNGLSLHAVIEEAFDHGRIIFVGTQIDKKPYEYKCLIIDNKLFRNDQIIQHGTLWKDMHNRSLLFLNSNRPSRSCLGFRYIMAYVRAGLGNIPEALHDHPLKDVRLITSGKIMNKSVLQKMFALTGATSWPEGIDPAAGYEDDSLSENESEMLAQDVVAVSRLAGEGEDEDLEEQDDEGDEQ